MFNIKPPEKFPLSVDENCRLTKMHASKTFSTLLVRHAGPVVEEDPGRLFVARLDRDVQCCVAI